MRPRKAWASWVSLLVGCALVAPGSTVPARAQGGNITTLPQYEGIADPLVNQQELDLLFFAPITSPYTTMLLETWRLEQLNFFAAVESPPQAALARAIATTAARNLRVGEEPAIQGGRLIIAKLKADLKWYEDNINSKFAQPGYQPTPDEKRFFDRYQAIQQALKSYTYQVQDAKTKQTEWKTLLSAETTLETQAKAFSDALTTVLSKAAKADYAIPSLRTDSGFLAGKLNALHETVFGLQQMALDLNENGKTPRQQLRANFTNTSNNLVFFVQVQTLDPRTGQYIVRPDTTYPVVIYPDVSQVSAADLAKLQINPVTPGGRGASRTWLPVGLRDKLIVRVATMGQLRDRIHFQIIQGTYVAPELASLTRGFYYLGYYADLPAGMLVSRWYPVQETYTWAFRGGWAPGGSAHDPQLLSSNGADLRGGDVKPPQPLQMTADRMEWILPAGFETAVDMGKAWAQIQGQASFMHIDVAPGRDNSTQLTEAGSGNFEMRLEAW